MRRSKITVFLSILMLVFIVHPIAHGQQLTMLLDSDRDGLPDSMEEKLGISPYTTDTDGDGLTDYVEVRKYHTDPRLSDSDQDGIPDNDWQERREFTYTIQAFVDLRPPFEVAQMNDFFQDARQYAIPYKEVTRVEVILYPYADMLLNVRPFTPQTSKWTVPTYAKNYTAEMVQTAGELTRSATNEFEAVNAILRYVRRFRRIYAEKEFGYGSTMPIHFHIYRDQTGAITMENLPEQNSPEEIQATLEHVYFADGMFRHHTRGACSSSAVLRGAMLRAAGIPERTIFTIPLIYYYDSDKTVISVKEEFQDGYHHVSGAKIVNHVLNEVFIGEQWIRVDNEIKKGILYGPKDHPKLSVKILMFHDPTEYNFTTYWNYQTWRQHRPYTYIRVQEQEPRYNYKSFNRRLKGSMNSKE